MNLITFVFGLKVIVNKDCYKILQVDPEAEQDVIEAAYRRLAFKYHPDKDASSTAHHRMQEINVAYDRVKTIDKRAQYDRERTVARQDGNVNANPAEAKLDDSEKHDEQKNTQRGGKTDKKGAEPFFLKILFIPLEKTWLGNLVIRFFLVIIVVLFVQGIHERIFIVPGRFTIAYTADRKIITDSKTGLQWLCSGIWDAERITTFEKAMEWVKKQNVAGGRWRMPKIAELETLHSAELRDCLSGDVFWSSTTFSKKQKNRIIELSNQVERAIKPDVFCEKESSFINWRFNIRTGIVIYCGNDTDRAFFLAVRHKM